MRLIPFLVATVLLAPPALTAPGLRQHSGENVLLVVNRNSEVSQRIGEHYSRRRSVPASNLCRIETLEQETVTRQVYQREIEAPVASCLARLGGQRKIFFIATTKGVPLRIAGKTGLRGDAAAVDSELTLLELRRRGENAGLEGPYPNPFFRQRPPAFDNRTHPIYLVTRLTGFTLEDVRAMIDRGLEARNRGLFVIDIAPGRDAAGNQALLSAARLLPRARVHLDQTPEVLYGVKSVIGYASWGSNDPRRAQERQRNLGFEWLPGAIATEYVSTNARTFEEPPEDWRLGASWRDRERHYAGSPQGLTGDLIRQGATGASGHVYEPYLRGTPQPDYLFPAYYQGRTLAESFYLAMPYLSWMNVVVGDPLCSLGPPGR